MKNVFIKIITLLTMITVFTSCESSDNDLDEVIEEIDSCAGLDFESRVYVDGGVFGEFIAEGIVSESAIKYEWKINDEFVSNETVCDTALIPELFNISAAKDCDPKLCFSSLK